MRSSLARLLNLSRTNRWRFPHRLWEIGRGRANHLFPRDFAKGTGDPLWILLDTLRRPWEIKPLKEAILENGMSEDEFERWRGAVEAVDIDQALSKIEETRFLIAQPNLSESTDMQAIPHRNAVHSLLDKRRVPDWLVMYMVCHQVQTPSQANGTLLTLVFDQLPMMPSHLQPSLLVLTALSLAKYSLLLPIKRVQDVFLSIVVDQPTLHFNLFLQAITRLPKSTEAANLAVRILEVMTTRGLHLNSRTYNTLLADRFVTLQLTKRLQTKMMHEGYRPTVSQLEAFVRVFAKNGVIHDAKKYHDALRLHRLKRGSSVVPVDAGLAGTGNPHSATTSYIAGFGTDSMSAFQYLRRLLDRSIQLEDTPTSNTHDCNHNRPKRLCKRSVDVWDWTMTFTRFALDMSTTSHQLVQLFHETSKSPTFRPTVATYTILIRGLIRRKEYQQAVYIWDNLVNAGLRVDRKALGAGVHALTLAGEPLRALTTLESYAATPTNVLDSQQLQDRPAGLRRLPVKLDTRVLGDFMSGLMHIDRPDVVFKLWSYMEELYNVSPDDHLLELLCRAARLAYKLDAYSIKGTIAMMGWSNPFRMPDSEPTTREGMIQSIRELLGKRDNNAMSVWNNLPAHERVRQAFHRVMFTNWPHLRNVQVPAQAVRKPQSEDGPFQPFTEVVQSISRSTTPKQKTPTNGYGPGNSEIPKHTVSGIAPSEQTFFAYILLLGTSSCQSEIASVLACMRALHIKPRKSTLAISLIFWAEVSTRGPLLEDWAARNDRSEYERLKNWLIDWVGSDGMPHEGTIHRFLRVIAEVRDYNVPKRIHKGKYNHRSRNAVPRPEGAPNM